LDGITLEIIPELTKMVGFSALVFVIWLITLRFCLQIFKTHDQRYVDLLTSQKSILDEQSKREQQNFELLKQLIESNDYVAGAISSLSTKIDNNLFCPLMRKDNKS